VLLERLPYCWGPLTCRPALRPVERAAVFDTLSHELLVNPGRNVEVFDRANVPGSA
jgi:hypothetical protein